MTPDRLLKELDRRPLVAAVLLGGSALKDARRARALGADLLEVRIDSLPEREPRRVARLLQKIRQASNLPVLSTVRWWKEQGRTPGFHRLPDSERLALYSAAIPASDWVDVELGSAIASSVLKLARRNGKRVILSSHNFKAVPKRAEMNILVHRFKKLKGDILKIAATPKNRKEAAELLARCLEFHPLRRVFIAMGPHGRLSRLAGFLFGSGISYGFVRASSAPGQVSVRELVQSFRQFDPPSK